MCDDIGYHSVNFEYAGLTVFLLSNRVTYVRRFEGPYRLVFFFKIKKVYKNLQFKDQTIPKKSSSRAHCILADDNGTFFLNAVNQ